MNKKLTLAALMSLSAASAAAQRPNIILFLVDDMGWQDTSYPFADSVTHFNRTYSTPNMEALAKKGVTFTNAYASAVSSPTRTSLMTGLNPAAHRVTNWTLRRDQSTDHINDLSIDLPSWNNNGLQPIGAGINNSIEAVTLPQVLQKEGYYTIHSGKAHWGVYGTPGENPLNLGFDVNIAGFAAGGPASYLPGENFGHYADGKPKNDFAIPGLEKYWGTETFLTDALTLEAKGAMDKAQQIGKPFYLYLSHYAIHVPLNKDSRYYQKYLDRGLNDTEARYAALIEGMDKSLGDVMQYLKEKNIEDNTIIIFMSDNGGLSQHGRSGKSDTHNLPLNNGKGSPYEGGVRVPMMVYWNGVTKAATRCDKTVEICDFMPTIAEMAGVKRLRTPQPQHGYSLVPLLKGAKWEHDHRSLVWHFPNRWIPYGNPKGHGYGTYSSILKDGIKLIYYYDYDFTELYDLNRDLGETVDLANNESYSKSKVELADELTSKLKGYGAQIPRFKDGKHCKYPNGTLPQ